MNNFCENINTNSVKLSLLMCGASFIFTKDEYLCSFLDAVPRLVILCHLLQPVVSLLLRLAVVVLPQVHLTTLLASAPDSKSVSATKISLMASSNLIFFAAISQRKQWSALFIPLCVTGHSCRNLMPRRYELLLQ